MAPAKPITVTEKEPVESKQDGLFDNNISAIINNEGGVDDTFGFNNSSDEITATGDKSKQVMSPTS